MKRLLLVLSLSLSLTPAFAEEEQPFCEQIYGLAEVVMTARQSGVPILDVMKIGKDSEGIQGIVRDAYSQPTYRTEEMQERTIQEFATSYYLQCLKMERKK